MMGKKKHSFRDCDCGSPSTSSSGSLTRKNETALVDGEGCDAGELARGSDCGGGDNVCICILNVNTTFNSNQYQLSTLIDLQFRRLSANPAKKAC